jgi:hypothetical protein
MAYEVPKRHATAGLLGESWGRWPETDGLGPRGSRDVRRRRAARRRAAARRETRRESVLSSVAGLGRLGEQLQKRIIAAREPENSI